MTMVEPSRTPTPVRRESPVSALAWVLGAALAVALVAVAWLYFERDQTGTGPVSDEIAAMLEERVTALNEGDADMAAALYAEDAIVTNEITNWEAVGREAISEELKYLTSANVEMEPQGEPFQITDNIVAQVHRAEWGFGLQGDDFVAEGEFILIHEIDADGMIAHEYMIGWLSQD